MLPCKKTRNRNRSNRRPTTRRYSFEFKLKVVKLHLEDGFTQEMVCEEMGMCTSSFSLWMKAYKERGEERLRSLLPPPGGVAYGVGGVNA